MSGTEADDDVAWQRLDKWLWCARFLRQRGDCAALAGGGLRINRQPTDKPHARLRVGDRLTLPLRQAVLVIEVLALATRRGPATEARTLYREIAPDAAGSRGCDRGSDAAYPPPPSPDARSAR